MTIRDATESDMPAIVEIYNATVPTRMVTADLKPVTVEERMEWFRAHSANQYPFWVADGPPGVRGWLSFQPFKTRRAYGGTAEISVYVHSDFQRQGMATSLLDKALAYCPRLSITALVGFVFGHNEPSLKFFDRFGFERWGVLPRVAQLDGIERDVIVLGRHISSPE